jgi:hypothetical protein
MAGAPTVVRRPKKITVSRSEFRERMREFLGKTTGNTVVVVTTPGAQENKLVVDAEYFDELVRDLQSAVETLEITSDPELYARLLKAPETLKEDFRAGRLHSLEEAFGED